MNKWIILTFFVLIGCSSHSDPSKSSRKIQNLKTFARVYGYVKYFHPSDEASELNWNKFASYGALRVLPCKTDTELIGELRNIFGPIAPSVIFSSERNDSYGFSEIEPTNLDDYNLTFWQHRGVSLGMKANYRSPYESVRVNSLIKRDEPKNYGILVNSIDAQEYRNKRIRLKMLARLDDTTGVSAYMRLASIDSDGSTVLEKSDIEATAWTPYEIVFNTGESSESVEIGAALKGDTSLLIDGVRLSFWNGDKWETIPVENFDFEQGELSASSAPKGWSTRGEGYSSDVSIEKPFEGQGSARLFRQEPPPEIGKKLFETEPAFGEYVNKEIGSSVFCKVPIVLYTGRTGTYPKADSLDFRRIRKEMDSLSGRTTDIHVRLGNIINSYNVFQNFYPYMDIVDVDWDRELDLALSRSFKDSTASDHYVTLEKFTSPLRDGHVYVDFPGIREIYAPRITWEWIEDKLIITRVLDNKIPLKIGDVVMHVDGIRSKEYFKEIESRISAGTEGWLDFKAKRKSLLGEYGQSMTVTVDETETPLDRLSLAYNEPPRQSAYEKINDSVYYLNLSLIEMDTITGLLPKLSKARAIICDLRGYPNGNHMFISHLLKEKDTSASWMQIPKIIYPNRKDIVGYEEHGWSLPQRVPYLGNKRIIFITDGSAISYAESFMGFIEGYDLATIIGQPTAGTNGNINTFDLEGGFSITWTGMKVLKHDGSQHHSIGITPDLYLSKTIEGIKAGRDEFFEKAIELSE